MESLNFYSVLNRNNKKNSKLLRLPHQISQEVIFIKSKKRQLLF